MTLGVYIFYKNFGRSGSLHGLFMADGSEVSSSFGKTAYFGEVLGKHSDVCCKLSEGDIELITEEPSEVSMFDNLNVCFGYNPLEYISDTE